MKENSKTKRKRKNHKLRPTVRIKFPYFDIDDTIHKIGKKIDEKIDNDENFAEIFNVFDKAFDALWYSSKGEKDKMKKKKMKKHAKYNMKILNSGKVKINGKEKFDLSPFIKDSIDKSVVSRLDAVITKEKVEIDSEGRVPTKVSSTLIDELSTAEIAFRLDDRVNPTIVIPMYKKNATDVFNYLQDGVLGDVLRSSTLAAVYAKLKAEWVNLNEDDKSGFTNVLFAPNILVFIDRDGRLRKKPFMINVCIVAIPSPAKMEKSADTTEVVDKISDDDVAARIIVDMVESTIKCGGTRMIVNPFAMKPLTKDISVTSDLWNQIITSERSLSQLESIDFSIEDEDFYIVFNARRNH